MLVAPNDQVPMVSVDIVYTFDSTDVPAGVPHLTEHLLFESTQHLANGEVDRLIRLAGGRSTASTTWDRIVISDTIASSNLSILLSIEAERSQYLCEGITAEHLTISAPWRTRTLLHDRTTKWRTCGSSPKKSFATHPVISSEVMGRFMI